MAFPTPTSIGENGAMPSGLAVSDLMIATLTAKAQGGTQIQGITVPSGWATLSSNGSGLGAPAFGMFWKIATSGDVSSFAAPTAVGVQTTATLRFAAGTFDASNPIGVFKEQATFGSSPSLSMSGVTVAEQATLFLIGAEADQTNGGALVVFSAPAIVNNNPTWTTDKNQSGNNNSNGHAYIGIFHGNYTGAPASATGTISMTGGGGGSGTYDLWAVSVNPFQPVNTLFGSTFGFLSFIVNDVFVNGLFGSIFSVLAPTLTTSTIWTRKQKDSDAWTTQNRSTL